MFNALRAYSHQAEAEKKAKTIFNKNAFQSNAYRPLVDHMPACARYKCENDRRKNSLSITHALDVNEL